MPEEEVTTRENAGIVDLSALEAGPTFSGSARHAVRRVVTRYPEPYLSIARRRHPQGTLTSDTQLVIDGFTRSAITFALVAFQVAQNGHVRVAHHLHSPAQLIQAARRGIPGLVPIRPPQDTVLSAMIREPSVSVGQWLRTYAGFYRRVLPSADGLVFARFESVTTDLGSVTAELNRRFGTAFVEFSQNEADVARAFALIDERSRRPPWKHVLGEFLAGRISLDEYREQTAEQRGLVHLGEVPQERVQRPSASRRARRAALLKRYEDPDLKVWRARAQAAYEAVEERAV
jgi:hypothetical protein